MTKTDNDNEVSWLHRLASLLAVLTFLVFMTGMLASGSGGGARSAGKSSAGPLNSYAHISYIFAVAAGIVTVILFVLLIRSTSQRYIKVLAGVTLAVMLVVAFLFLGAAHGISPAVLSFGYLCGIQTFFALTVCLALFTRGDWGWNEDKTADLASPSLRQIVIFTTVAIFLQPMLGDAFQQNRIGIAPHFIIGFAVLACVMWVMEMALTKFQSLRPFKMAAIFLAVLVGVEFFLGIITYSMNLNARSVAGLESGLVVMNATHAVVGILVLATSLFVTFQAFKYFAPAGNKVISSSMAGEPRQTEPEQD